ncbi:MAG: DUF418 domain-containing protein, partial [Porticoccaceae bacterium]|nr:DUF418 domain-containing protein [Porticoccaceae bacterium]
YTRGKACQDLKKSKNSDLCSDHAPVHAWESFLGGIGALLVILFDWYWCFLVLLFWYGCRVLGLMMIGIALFKIDFFGHRFTRKSLQLQGLIFFILGAFIICARINSNIAKEFPIEAIFSLENYWGSLLLAYSYMCWILAFSRSQLFPSAKRALANVGRMALTNYISQTLICGFIFYGWGLGKFGSFNRIEQIYVVVVIWIFQIACSHSWMQRFQFGPLEWILRSITYGRMQTIKRP